MRRAAVSGDSWLSTAWTSETVAYFFAFNASRIFPAYDDSLRYHGFTVRHKFLVWGMAFC